MSQGSAPTVIDMGQLGSAEGLPLKEGEVQEESNYYLDRSKREVIIIWTGSGEGNYYLDRFKRKVIVIRPACSCCLFI